VTDFVEKELVDMAKNGNPNPLFNFWKNKREQFLRTLAYRKP